MNFSTTFEFIVMHLYMGIQMLYVDTVYDLIFLALNVGHSNKICQFVLYTK